MTGPGMLPTILSSLLAMAVAADVAQRRIPNLVVVMLAAAGVAAQLIGAGPAAALTGALTGAGVLALLILPWASGKVGGGDVKLIAATAVWLGPSRVLTFLALTAVAGAPVALATRVAYLCRPGACLAKLPRAGSHSSGNASCPRRCPMPLLWRSAPPPRSTRFCHESRARPKPVQRGRLVEFVLVVPLLILLLLAAIDWGRYFVLRENAIHATREGARVGSVARDAGGRGSRRDDCRPELPDQRARAAARPIPDVSTEGVVGGHRVITVRLISYPAGSIIGLDGLTHVPDTINTRADMRLEVQP